MGTALPISTFPPKVYTHLMANTLITISNCRIENSKNTILSNINWTMNQGESWLVIGPNGGGKADFINALSGNLKITPNYKDLRIKSEGDSNNNVILGLDPGILNDNCSIYSNVFQNSTEIVSLERAARLIQEERENDESEYVEGGVDIGRTGRIFIGESICGNIKKGTKGTALPAEVANLDREPAIKLCGIEHILDRGLKYMSTGEIRRTLLARALISNKQLLILSDPFAGLDVQSRTILLDFFNNIAKKQSPHIILGMERWHEIPDAITNVIEFTDKTISFCSTRSEYEKLITSRAKENADYIEEKREKFANELNQTLSETFVLQNENATSTSTQTAETLIEMNNVNVGWDDHRVLIDLTWKLNKGEHWLVRGPNGSGKTTFLELITGDNMQVFCNDVRIFGNRRGSGESIWDIKKQLGIVSYRLHVEYRMLGGTSLRDVIVSGFRDSIGLYGAATDVEATAAKKWLALGGFEGRENEMFGNLSYGEQRAVLILRSAVKCPKILILDEPCHGLDEQYREKIMHLMELIANGGTTTMLHVTHDPTEVLPCEKHILELHPDESPMYRIIEN